MFSTLINDIFKLICLFLTFFLLAQQNGPGSPWIWPFLQGTRVFFSGKFKTKFGH